jgi:hypothetical protein
MGIVTSINWFWNWFLAFTWPYFYNAFTPFGAFMWYGAWCVVGWWIILLFVPETKDLSLEQLDQVFSIPTKEHAAHGMSQISYVTRRFLLRKRNVRRPVLIRKEDEDEKIVRRPARPFGEEEPSNNGPVLGLDVVYRSGSVYD